MRKEACDTCGSCTTTKIERCTPTPEQVAACPHANLNRSGSSRAVSRIYCKDCGTYVSEEPQSEATRAVAKAPPPRPRGSPSGYSQPVGRPNVAIPIDRLMLVVTTFKGLARTYAQKTEETSISQRQLEKLLEDAIDVVQDAGDSDGAPGAKGSAPKSSRQAAAMMHVDDPPKSSGDGDALLGGELPSGAHRLYHPDLETVDPSTDRRVFALLDEGCNAGCHSVAWAKHAASAFGEAGSHRPMSELDTTNTKSYKGIGNKKSLGFRRIPWASSTSATLLMAASAPKAAFGVMRWKATHLSSSRCMPRAHSDSSRMFRPAPAR